MIYTRNAQEKSWLRWAVILLTVMVAPSDVFGQWGFGADAGSADTTAKDSGATSGGGDGGWGMDGGGSAEEPAIKRAPYVRFVTPYDSMREIIFYENIIEDEMCENCGADSLYWRAKKYLVQRLGKEGYKKMVVEDKLAERIVEVRTNQLQDKAQRLNGLARAAGPDLTALKALLGEIDSRIAPLIGRVQRIAGELSP